MKILVTGGAGFIGSNFIKYILDKYKDMSIINYDALTYSGNLENLKDIENSERYKFIQGNISDNAALEKVFKDFQPDYGDGKNVRDWIYVLDHLSLKKLKS